MVLRSVPGQVSSGPGWRYNLADGEVDVTGEGAVLSGLTIRCNVNISASKVTIADDRIVTGGLFGISLRHTAGVMIEHSTISGLNATSGRVAYAIDDIYGDSTGLVIKADNILFFSHGIQVSSGTIYDNYIHDPGYILGDHIDGIFDPGTTHSLMISYNTILNGLGQTAAISLDASATGQAVANKTVVDNLLGGGGYVIYGGAARDDRISHIVIKNNRFSQVYYPRAVSMAQSPTSTPGALETPGQGTSGTAPGGRSPRRNVRASLNMRDNSQDTVQADGGIIAMSPSCTSSIR